MSGDSTNQPGIARQALVIERARTLLPEDERILAVYLIGSHASGEADEFSDVDVHCVVTEESLPWFEQHWTEPLVTIAGPLVFTDRVPGLIGGLGIAADCSMSTSSSRRRPPSTDTSTTVCGCSSIATAPFSRPATSPATAADPVRRTGPSAP